MDPNACYARWHQAREAGDRIESLAAYDDLCEWLERGGFEPEWTELERDEFIMWKQGTP